MPAVGDTKYLVKMGWNDAPHLTPEKKKDMLRMTPPALRMARMEGEPVVGVGRIWPMPWERISCRPFDVPDSWPRCYALDPGWKRTAALWLAHDRSTDTAYAYGEYYNSELEPHVNALAIKAFGEWIPGVIDPSSMKGNSDDGRKLAHQYRDAGLRLRFADNDVDSGIAAVWTRLKESRLKVFEHLQHFRFEFNQYHRDEKWNVVKANDHLMDCVRYAVMSGLRIAVRERDAVRPKGSPGRPWEPSDSRAGY